MLTPAEHKAMLLTAQLMNVYAQEIVADGPTRSADVNEFARHVHDIQHAIMAQSAARVHPELYRLAGGTIGDERRTAILIAASLADAQAFKAGLADDIHVAATITPRSMRACRGITADTITATPEAKAHPKYADMLAEAQICTLANATVR